MGEPLKQGGEFFCSVECANVAQGIDPDDPLVYENEDFDEEFFEEPEG
ncbi:MAG: hypothetical protein AB1772_10525 [Candidatus Zixiibacteriota bacterium]